MRKWKFLFPEKKEEKMKKSFSLYLCIASTGSPLPCHAASFGALANCFADSERNLCTFCSINATGWNLLELALMYIIRLFLSLLVISLCRWTLVKHTAIISRAMACTSKYLGPLLGFKHIKLNGFPVSATEFRNNWKVSVLDESPCFVTTEWQTSDKWKPG